MTLLWTEAAAVDSVTSSIIAALAALLIASPLTVSAQESAPKSKPSPLAGQGIQKKHQPYTAEEIAVMTRRVAMLMEREAMREADGSGGVVIGNERPPHY